MQNSSISFLIKGRTVHQFAERLEDLACQVSNASKAHFYFFDSENHVLTRQDEQSMALTESTQPGRCALYREVIHDPLEVPGLSPASNAVSLPVRYFGTLIGILTVENPQAWEPLTALAELAGIGYEFVRRGEELEEMSSRTQEMFVQAVEAVSAWGPGHVGKVARVAAELAGMLDLSIQIRSEIFQAAQYHDIGLLVQGGQTEFERQRAHPQIGASYLLGSKSLRNLAPLVEHHHERYDGSGFPSGLAGEALPLEVWVLSTAEDLAEFWFEKSHLAMKERVAAFFEERAASHHPEVIDALCGLIDSGRLDDVL